MSQTLRSAFCGVRVVHSRTRHASGPIGDSSESPQKDPHVRGARGRPNIQSHRVGYVLVKSYSVNSSRSGCPLPPQRVRERRSLPGPRQSMDGGRVVVRKSRRGAARRSARGRPACAVSTRARLPPARCRPPWPLPPPAPSPARRPALEVTWRPHRALMECAHRRAVVAARRAGFAATLLRGQGTAALAAAPPRRPPRHRATPAAPPQPRRALPRHPTPRTVAPSPRC